MKQTKGDISAPFTLCELDSHADTCCFGDACKVMYETGRADVRGFHEDLGQLKEAKIATVMVAYDNESTGETMLLIFHQVLYLPRLDHHLLNPFQMRQNGITINDIPLLHLASEDRNMESHSNITNQKELIIPLQLNGIFSCF